MVKSEDRNARVFYIEKVEFLRSMMEFALKAKGAEIYTIDTLENNFYLLDDLLPDLIIFDVETAKNHLEQLKNYQTRAVLVAVGDESLSPLVSGWVKTFIAKPIEAKNIGARVLALLD